MKTRILQLIFVLILAFGLAPVSQAEGLKYKATYDGTFLDTSFDINEDGFFTDVVRGTGKGTFRPQDLLNSAVVGRHAQNIVVRQTPVNGHIHREVRFGLYFCL